MPSVPTAVCLNRNYVRIERIVQEYLVVLYLLNELVEGKLRNTPRRHSKILRERAYQATLLRLMHEKVANFKFQAAAEFASECRLDNLFESYAWLNPEFAARHYRFVEAVRR